MLATSVASVTKKRVRFPEELDKKEAKRAQPKASLMGNATDSEQDSFILLNLKATKSVCCHLSKACWSRVNCSDPCLGYLEGPRHPPSPTLMFYDAAKLTVKRPHIENAYKKVMPAKDLLQGLHTLHQLTLAYKLAASVLQHHSTPWLQQDWNLKEDIAFFTDSTATAEPDITTKLQSLHLSSHFLSDPLTVIKAKQKPEDMKYMYGIRNLTLANLGVALLEICAQKEISEVTLDTTPHGVISARKLLLEDHHAFRSLGKRYLNIAQKCIDCDFSCGDNLDDEKLQSAVYTDVVCGLEDMRNDWRRFFGVD